MTNRTIFRAIAATFIFGSLAACETTTTPMVDTPAPRATAAANTEAAAKPISSAELLAIAANTTADGRVRLLNNRGRGYILNTDNTITYIPFRARSVSENVGAVTEVQGNRTCMDKTGNYNTACLNFYQVSDGSIRTVYEFPTGKTGQVNSTPFGG